MVPFTRRAHTRAAASLAGLTAVGLTLTGCLGFPLASPGSAQAAGAASFDQVQTAVVQIESVGTFRHPTYGGYEAAGFGSGFVISADGLALTNNHVVTGAGTLKVWLGGDTAHSMNARVLGSSECLDLAVVQLPQGSYPYLDWATGAIDVAGDVYAAGFPLADPAFTMTRGIVSKSATPVDTAWASLDRVIEHDARIRTGNSGGPLVNSEGRVIGVNYAGSDLHDLNYAIHRDEVLAVLDDLAAGTNVLSLGINAQGLLDEQGNGLGVWVNSVASGGIADQAGVLPGDVITRLQGVSVGLDGTLADYCDVLRTHGTDRSIDIEVYRPDDGRYHRGKLNGERLEPVTVLGEPSTGSQAVGQFVTVSDDSGTVSVDIPAGWHDIDGSAAEDMRGNVYQSLVASPSLSAYDAGWSVPGVTVMASQAAVTNTTPEELVHMMAQSLPQHGCVSILKDAYDDGYHIGEFEYWSDCGPEKAQFVVVGARSTAGDYLVLVTIQAVTDPDLDAIDRVLGSFIASY